MAEATMALNGATLSKDAADALVGMMEHPGWNTYKHVLGCQQDDEARDSLGRPDETSSEQVGRDKGRFGLFEELLGFKESFASSYDEHFVEN